MDGDEYDAFFLNMVRIEYITRDIDAREVTRITAVPMEAKNSGTGRAAVRCRRIIGISGRLIRRSTKRAAAGRIRR